MREQDVFEALRLVIDPEVGVNVVDLGLVYGVDVGDGEVVVRMTMTTPACPLSAYLREEATNTIAYRIPEARDIHVDVVWDPPWDASRISDEGRRQLGWS